MDRLELHRQIDHIFRDLLPAAGMTEREEQITLCHRLLDAMLNGKIALCDAGTGIGKTHAYLIAGLVFLRCRSFDNIKFRPIIISTSNIALQTELHREYIPQLAKILAEDGWNINQTELSVIRKGKRHYVCEQHLEWRLRTMSRRSPKRIQKLLALQSELDMDGAGSISGYDKNLLQVPAVCARCRRKHCRYLDFLDDCATTPYLFQICNHNLFLADAVRRHHGYRPLFPDACSVVIDEAHKLPETAREMLELTLDGQDIRSLIRRLNKSRYLLAAELFSDASAPLLKKLDAPPEAIPFQSYARLLSPLERMLKRIRNALYRELSLSILTHLDSLASKISFFLCADETETLLYTQKTNENQTMLGATLPDLTKPLQDILWNTLDSAMLVSGTLAIHGDFTRYKNAVGLQTVGRVEESVSLSPFDYKKNCLLYFPLSPPRMESCNFIERLADEIERLLNAANGHALVLFTSYAQLTSVKKRCPGENFTGLCTLPKTRTRRIL